MDRRKWARPLLCCDISWHIFLSVSLLLCVTDSGLILFARHSLSFSRILAHHFLDIFTSFWIWSGTCFSVLSFTPLILVRTDSHNESLAITYGPLHLAFGVYFVTCLISALYLLNQKRKRLSGTDRAHARYLLLAVFSTAIGATVTNLILPIVVGTSRYGEVLPDLHFTASRTDRPRYPTPSTHEHSICDKTWSRLPYRICCIGAHTLWFY